MKQEVTLTFEHGRWCLRGNNKPRHRTAVELTARRALKYFKHVHRKYVWMKNKGTFNKHTWMEVFSK